MDANSTHDRLHYTVVKRDILENEHPFIYLNLFIYLSIYLFIYLFKHLFIYVCLLIYLQNGQVFIKKYSVANCCTRCGSRVLHASW